MKQILRKYFYLAALASVLASSLGAVTPYYSIRSQSEDSARELVGWAHQVNLYDIGGLYGSFAVTPEYAQSFKSCDIADCLFGRDLQCNCDCPTITISGSRVANRGPRDWLADYFGLAPDFQSRITFDPIVKTFLVDFNLYLGMDDWLEGLYFRIHAPVVHTRWKLNYCETICESGTLGYDEGYFGPYSVSRENLVDQFSKYVSECQTPVLNREVNNNVCFLPLQCCKWAGCCCNETLIETRLSDVQMALGWNFYQNENYHFGINLRAAAPTGTRPDGKFLFEPVVGNGHHWEFGVGYTTHVMIWQSEDENRSFNFYSDGNFTHLFRTRQTRCFDLCNSPNSRYMLAEKLGKPVSNLYANTIPGGGGSAFQPIAQFKDVFTPVANLTKADVDVSVGVQIDITAMFNYQTGGFEWDFGYNFWGKTCDKIHFNCCPFPFVNNKTWGLKGDAHVYGFNSSTNAPIPLSATQTCGATIHSGKNGFTGINGNEGGVNGLRPTRNPGVDNRRFAQATSSNGTLINDRRTTNPAGAAQTQTSFDPIFLTPEDVNVCGARSRGISHKVFTHVSYTWWDNERWIPYIGVGGKAEFAPNNRCDCCGVDSCDLGALACDELCTRFCDGECCGSCQSCNLSEWGVWVKGGVSFR